MSLAASPVGWLYRALELVWPPWCPGCHQPVTLRASCCPSCTASLPHIEAPYCAICGDALGRTTGICRRCQSESPCYRGGRSALRYEGVVRKVILAWKYEGVRYYEPLLRSWMLELAWSLPATRYASLDAIVPVPLHTRRLAWRGFNQATVLAQGIANCWGLPIWKGALLRTRFTEPQQRARSGAARSRNLEGAFVVPDPALVRHRRLLLIDDVATTGSTLQACAYALKQSGATSVTFLTLARQPLSGGAKAPPEAVRGLVDFD